MGSHASGGTYVLGTIDVTLRLEHYEGKTGNDGMYLGFMILGNLVFLGLFVMRTLKKDDW
jgi:hypothetical protein